MSARDDSPFSRFAMLGLVLFGALAFLGFLYAIGAGLGDRNPNDGNAHGGSKGLTGYAALGDFLTKRGHAVSLVQSRPGLMQGGLLIVTPPHNADIEELNKLVDNRRYQGPTLVITPKWFASGVAGQTLGAKKGWVALRNAQLPDWPGFHDEIAVKLEPMRSGGKTARWLGGGTVGDLPNSEHVLSGNYESLVPLVVGEQDGRVLAAYLFDGEYPALRAIAQGTPPDPYTDDEGEVDADIHPVIFVFEPDLLNNYGMAEQGSARLADRLVRAALSNHEGHEGVAFDLTLNGFVRSRNLLTLAVTPPFLAAALCLLLVALIVGWRGFTRFGPARVAGRGIAFGKRALVSNAAGLIRRTRRLHLVAAPYADAARERLARALALPPRLDPAASEAAIDRALAARSPDGVPFSVAAAQLRDARRPADMLRAAQILHALERTLTR